MLCTKSAIALVWRETIKRGWVQTVLHRGGEAGDNRGEGPGPPRALLFGVDAQGWVETPLMTPPIPPPIIAHTIPSQAPANGGACLRSQYCS